MERGVGLHLAESRTKNTHPCTGSKSKDVVGSQRETRRGTDISKASSKEQREKASVKNVLVLHYKLEENPVISLCSNFSQSKGNRQKNKSTERDKVSQWL